jgi:hypothetical protein
MTIKTLLDRMPTEKAAAIQKLLMAARKLKAQGKRLPASEVRRRKNAAQKERRKRLKNRIVFESSLAEMGDSNVDTV